MISAYGIAYADPFSVFSQLQKTLQDKKVELFIKAKDYSLTYPDVLMFLSVKDMVTYLRKYRTNRVVGIVFDSAIKLFDLKEIKLVDCKLDNCDLMPIKVKPEPNWFDSEQFKRNSSDVIEHTPRNLINLLIKFNVEGRFINYYNSFIYSMSAAKRREECKLLLVKYLFGVITKEEFTIEGDKLIKKRTSAIRKAFDCMVDYLSSDIGKNFLTALTEARSNTGDFKKYKAISDKYKVDGYELRYLSHVYLQFKKAGVL